MENKILYDPETGEIFSEEDLKESSTPIPVDISNLQRAPDLKLGYSLADLDVIKQMNDEDEKADTFFFKEISVHDKKNDPRKGLTDFTVTIFEGTDKEETFSGSYAFDNNPIMMVDSLDIKDLGIMSRNKIDMQKLKNELYVYSRRQSGQLIYNQSGLPVIAERQFFIVGKFNTLYVYPLHEHCIVFGGSGSGKTQSLVFPLIKSILDARENAVIHDCKLELFDHFGKQFKDAGYNVIVLNYADPRYSHRWNPFSYPIKLWKDTLAKNNCSPQNFRKAKEKGLGKAVERFKDVAQILCYEEDNDKNSYFWKAAGSMMAGAALLLAEEGKFDSINGKGIQMVYDINPADKEKDQVLRDFLGECRSVDDESSIQIRAYLDADGTTRGNISSTFRQKIEVISMNDDVRYITADSDFSLDEIYEKQTVVFVLTQDEKTQFYPLVTLFLKQLYEVGVELTRKGKYTSWPYKMNWILEEMGILPEIKDFKNIYNAARSRGLTIYGFMQSMSDMIDKYEMTGTKTILENCRMQVLVHAETEDTYEYFIKRCGKELHWKKNAAGGKGEWVAEDMFTKNRLRQFEKGRILFAPAELNPYVAKLPRYEQYTFYKPPVKGYLYSDEMFGKNGISYSADDLPWFNDMEAVTLRQKFVHGHTA